MQCPNKAQILQNLLPLLPRGDAWQSSEPPGQVFTVSMAQPGMFQSGMVQTLVNPPSVLHQFWAAIADVVAHVYKRFCDLQLEFFCATATETLDLWNEEYGLPNACDPFADLCAKVGITGGTQCDYFQSVALSAGWSIECVSPQASICAMMGAALLGCTFMGGTQGVSSIIVTVNLEESSAFQGAIQTQSLMGIYLMGLQTACAPDITGLTCILDQIVPAHVQTVYELN
jgi:uncharacterized protein YmfQ (DUF2313 family)